MLGLGGQVGVGGGQLGDDGADVVFLQEVLGTHSRHQKKVDNWPEAPHYEFLADTMWPQFAYGRNAVYPRGHHGNAVLSKFPIVHHRNHDVSVAGPEGAGYDYTVQQMHEVEQRLFKYIGDGQPIDRANTRVALA